MKNLGRFEQYTPRNPEYPGAMYLKNDEGTDWYSIAWDKKRVKDNIYAATDCNGIIVCVTDDVTSLTPLGFSVWEIPKKEAPSNILTEGYNASIVDGDYIFNYAAKAESRRQSLLSAANATIADWRTELQLGVISDDDKARLVTWMAYIKALKAVDFACVKDEMGYKAIEWPDKPE